MLKDFKLSDLKQMNNSDLIELAKEIRTKIIDVTSKNGGHLASNLGVVELTIALHKVFDSPKDKIIFDVSHQTYTHKLLTGRYENFDALRKMDGISGFAKMSESEHDVFEAGHSSTSISAALGFLEAKDAKQNEIGNVIAVVGDASVTNGLCFEALNYLAAKTNQKMIIIVNDNNMSISKNIGFIAKRYNSLRIKKSMGVFRKITPIRIKHALQYYAYRVDLFTSLGFKYFENIDGHDFNELIKYLNVAKNTFKSIVLHVKTKKGFGYKPAEEDKLGKWHGVPAFDIDSGEFKNQSKKPIFGEIISKQLCEYAKSEKGNLLRVICPAMALGTGIDGFQAEYPNQFIDIGIAEENGVVMASSMALMGLKPVYFVYATFLQRAYDEIIHDIARINAHVVFCVDHAGIVPSDGDTHQGIYDLGMYASIPGLTILNPTSAIDAENMIKYALDELDGPVIIRYPKGEVSLELETFSNDLSWKVIKKAKNYIISYTPNFDEVYQSEEIHNLEVGIVCAPVINPIDVKFINSLDDGAILYVYEDVIYHGSLASKILHYISQFDLNIKVKSICIADTYICCGKVNELKTKYHVSVDDLIKIIKEGK
ncbi:MAG: 1-deoxy-D-xylulose-5-phosphate synthase [Erysipelotrichaceae bacterium]|nr:1-deoxy-D-xylulose-5-phosphate synthase [Erysipelotrichaceae bacterium]